MPLDCTPLFEIWVSKREHRVQPSAVYKSQMGLLFTHFDRLVKMGAQSLYSGDKPLTSQDEKCIQRQQARLARKSMQDMCTHHDLEKGLGQKLGRCPLLL